MLGDYTAIWRDNRIMLWKIWQHRTTCNYDCSVDAYTYIKSITGKYVGGYYGMFQKLYAHFNS